MIKLGLRDLRLHWDCCWNIELLFRSQISNIGSCQMDWDVSCVGCEERDLVFFHEGHQF